MDNVLVIGDVHGHLDRLEALLKQEGLLVWCEWCNGGGEVWGGSAQHIGPRDCSRCKGIGWQRVRKDVTVVQLGDLAHFGTKGSPTGDLLCYKYVTENNWVDVVLWGNHDRAAVDAAHHASDFLQNYETLHYIKMLHAEGRMQIAFYAHGFVMTHAGLVHDFQNQKVNDKLKTDPEAFVEWINDQDDTWAEGRLEDLDEEALAVINAIGRKRGGRSPVGGILWRDINEKLYDGFRQIFGHSASWQGTVRYASKSWYSGKPGAAPENPSYCVDVGTPDNGSLAGIWLPSEKIVRVDL